VKTIYDHWQAIKQTKTGAKHVSFFLSIPHAWQPAVGIRTAQPLLLPYYPPTYHYASTRQSSALPPAFPSAATTLLRPKTAHIPHVFKHPRDII